MPQVQAEGVRAWAEIEIVEYIINWALKFPKEMRATEAVNDWAIERV